MKAKVSTGEPITIVPSEVLNNPQSDTEEISVSTQLVIDKNLSDKMKFFAFISMLLLVYVHGYNLNQRYLQPFSVVNEPLTFNTFFQYFISNGITRFRIPMLFAISGFLFAAKDYIPYFHQIKKRVKTLLVPYFLWSIIGLLIAVLLYNFNWSRQAVIDAHLQPVFNKTFDNYTSADWINALLWPTSFQLWFIRCLFFYNLLYLFIKKAVTRSPSIWFPIITIAWIMLLGFVVVEAEGLLFFSLGIWACKKQQEIQKKPIWFSMQWALPSFIFLCLFKTWWAFLGHQYLSEFPHGLSLLIMHKAVVALGLLVAWFGFDYLVKFAMSYKWFQHASNYGFIIFALHVPLLTYLIDPSINLLNNFQHARLLVFILLPLIIIAFCMFTGYILKLLLPKIYSVLTGGRGL